MIKEISAYLLYKDELYYSDNAFTFDTEQISDSIDDFVTQAYITLNENEQRELENVFCSQFEYSDENERLVVLLF